MDLSTLYWILILPNLGAGLGVIGAVGVTIGIFAHIPILIEMKNPERNAMAKNVQLRLILPAIFASLISGFVPSEKQMFYMIGGYAATNVENIEKLPKNVVNAANKFLETYTQNEKKK